MSTIPANSQNPHCTNENLKKLLDSAIDRLNHLNNHIFNSKSMDGYKYYNEMKTDIEAVKTESSAYNINNLLYTIDVQIEIIQKEIFKHTNALEILCKAYGNIQAFYYLSFGFPTQDQQTVGGKSKRNIKPKSDKRRTRRRKYFRYTPDKSKNISYKIY